MTKVEGRSLYIIRCYVFGRHTSVINAQTRLNKFNLLAFNIWVDMVFFLMLIVTFFLMMSSNGTELLHVVLIRRTVLDNVTTIIPLRQNLDKTNGVLSRLMNGVFCLGGSCVISATVKM